MSTEFYNRNWRMPNSWNGSTDNNNKVSNYSMSFDGSGLEYINFGTDIGDSLGNNYSGGISVSLWFKADFTGGDDGIFGFTNGTSTPSGYGPMSAVIYFGKIQLFYGGANKEAEVSFTDTTSWHHLVATFDTDLTGQLYLDNSPVGSSFTYNPTNADFIGTSFYVGNYYKNLTNTFNGKIDHVAIFDYALTDGTGGTVNQIAELYGNSTDGVGNPMAISGGRKPVAYYPIGDYAAFNGSEYLVNNGALQDYVFDFDAASSDYIDCGNDSSLALTSNFSVSAWMKSSSQTNYAVAVGKNSGNNGFSMQMRKDFNRFAFNINDGSWKQAYYDGINPIDDGKWHHVVGTFDGSTIKIYVDNIKGTDASSGTMTSNTANFIISGPNFPLFFNGQMSNVSYWNTALTSAQITELYNQGKPSNLNNHSAYSNLVSWWKLNASATFDSSTSTWSIPDDSSNSNTGTSSGMTAANLVQSNLNITTPYSRYACDFDGVDESFAAAIPGSFFSRNNAFSISLWTQSDNRLNIKGVVGNGSSGNCIRLRSANSGAPVFGIKYNFFMSGNFATSPGYHLSVESDGLVWTADTWYNIVITYDGSSTGAGLKMYINNGTAKVSTSADFTTSDCVSSSDFAIGAIRQTPFNTGLDGRLSNVSIWNAELTSTQVTEIYNEGKPSNLNNHSAYSNLTNWYQLGENSSFDGTNWTVLDEKGTNNGTGANLAPAEDSIVNGVGTSANGLSDGMGGADNIIGDAPYSTANAVSYGMGVDALSTSVPS